MLMTHIHRHPAAGLRFSMISGWKCSSIKNGRTSFQFTSGTVPSSMLILKLRMSSRKLLTLFSNDFFAASQLRSLSRTRPFFCTKI